MQRAEMNSVSESLRLMCSGRVTLHAQPIKRGCLILREICQSGSDEREQEPEPSRAGLRRIMQKLDPSAAGRLQLLHPFSPLLAITLKTPNSGEQTVQTCAMA